MVHVALSCPDRFSILLLRYNQSGASLRTVGAPVFRAARAQRPGRRPREDYTYIHIFVWSRRKISTLADRSGTDISGSFIKYSRRQAVTTVQLRVAKWL